MFTYRTIGLIVLMPFIYILQCGIYCSSLRGLSLMLHDSVARITVASRMHFRHVTLDVNSKGLEDGLLV